jgi:UDP-GlcNAc:undecaprenyl-phosphate/decaprenyl-phosphate GlcNAc-1-phosphate transferase
MPVIVFYIFLIALFTSMVMIPPLSNLAIKIGGVDRPDERKVHKGDIPRLGGIAIFCAFLFATTFISEIDRAVKGLIAGSIVIFLTGLADDLVTLSPRAKFLGEIMAVTIGVVTGGVSLSALGDPFSCGNLRLGFCTVPFTIFAIVGVINAINLIDGLDGLAAGISAIACVAFAILAFKTTNIHLVSLCVALLGAIVGFLYYNTFPAKIFMGDSGSLFIGYCVGFFSVMLVSESGGKISPVTPLVVLGLPVIDTLFVMTMRLCRGAGAFSPDRTHIHHRLLGLGLGHKLTVILVYAISYLLVVFALAGHQLPDYQLFWGLAIVLTVLYIMVHLLTRAGSADSLPVVRSNQSLRNTQTYHKLVERSHCLLLAIKYLLILVFLLPFFMTPLRSYSMALMSAVLLALTFGLFLSKGEWGNNLLQVVLYLNGCFIVFLLENFGRDARLFDVSLLTVSNCLFITLFVVEGMKMFLRKRPGDLITSPFEYLLLFVVVTVPLLPSEFTARYHLLTVAGKAVIMSVAFKLIFMRQATRNKKVILATSLALLVCAVKFLR